MLRTSVREEEVDGWMDALAILPVFSPGSQDLKVTVLRFS
jgi:hypothetical protein